MNMPSQKQSKLFYAFIVTVLHKFTACMCARSFSRLTKTSIRTLKSFLTAIRTECMNLKSCVFYRVAFRDDTYMSSLDSDEVLNYFHCGRALPALTKLRERAFDKMHF
jgi:hypothetical protein